MAELIGLAGLVACPVCRGRGVQVVIHRDISGRYEATQICNKCSGHGWVIQPVTLDELRAFLEGKGPTS